MHENQISDINIVENQPHSKISTVHEGINEDLEINQEERDQVRIVSVIISTKHVENSKSKMQQVTWVKSMSISSKKIRPTINHLQVPTHFDYDHRSVHNKPNGLMYRSLIESHFSVTRIAKNWKKRKKLVI